MQISLKRRLALSLKLEICRDVLLIMGHSGQEPRVTPIARRVLET